jgi:hypothetical protein
MRFRLRLRSRIGLFLRLIIAAGASGCATGPLEEARLLPDAPRPTMMPEVTHPDGEVSLEQTTGSVTPRGSDSVGHLPVQVTRIAAEQPIVSRLVFVGAAYEAAYGNPTSPQASKWIGGNFEVNARAVWATKTGLAFGAGLGVMLPTAQFNRGSNVNDLAQAAIALRPWDYAFFAQGNLALRPSIDIRYIVGPLVFQAREIMDGTFDIEQKNDFEVDIISTFYVAVRPRKDIALGVEIGELYRVSANNVPDDERADFTIAPTFRLILPRLQPALAVMTNAGDPYYLGANRIWAVKSTLTALW